jgi:hypothetical protein
VPWSEVGYTYIGFMADISIVVNEVDRPTYQLVK